MSCELDNDACIGTDIATANDIDVSLRKIDILDTDTPKISLYGLSTDVGGGGTGFGLERELLPHNRMVTESERIVVTCSLHAHSLTFQYPVEKLIPLGGNKKCTLLQLLHTSCALQE